MAVKFKSVLKAEPGVPGGGVKKYYAQIVHSGVVDFDKLGTLISLATTVSRTDVLAVLDALETYMNLELESGGNLHLGNFGNFRLSSHSEGVDAEEDVTSHIIESTSIIFTPGKSIEKMLKNLEYVKIKPDETP
jgi:predicted histone-like DNA-binding protein